MNVCRVIPPAIELSQRPIWVLNPFATDPKRTNSCPKLFGDFASTRTPPRIARTRTRAAQDGIANSQCTFGHCSPISSPGGGLISSVSSLERLFVNRCRSTRGRATFLCFVVIGAVLVHLVWGIYG